MSFTDACHRPISYLRISVTDRCNLRCLYCMPAEGVQKREHDAILSYEEIERVVRAAARLGINKVRLTGGEPLVRPGIVELVKMLAHIEGIDDLAMTTNGLLLTRYAQELATAGLKRVNVSLDTLQAEKYAQITRGGKMAEVFAGIAAAQKAGLRPIKINTVVMKGLNDDELVAMAALTRAQEWHVRFIELMPLNSNPQGFAESFLATAEVKKRIIEALGELEPVYPLEGNGPAAYWRLQGALGSIGFISPVSEHFCGQCNRLRLTADGRLRPCLLADREIDLRTILRRGAGNEEIQDILRQAILAKPERHHLDEDAFPHGRVMSEIGG